jgi:hypothetical protein
MIDVYLSPQDYKVAESNGISRDIAYSRFYILGWNRERAITQPVKKKNPEKIRWRKIAKTNGIPYTTYYERLTAGWTFEQAATTPKLTQEQRSQRLREAHCSVFTLDQLETMKSNGISYGTALSRVRNCGWTAEKAISHPINTQFRRKA